jgi:hypothetical protein
MRLGLSCIVVAGSAVAVLGCESVGASQRSQSTTHTYYIAADEVAWDYAPSGLDQITGRPFDEIGRIFMQSGPDRIGRVYKKALYREYTDETYTTLKPRPPEWEHLGFLGPLVRAEVGDTIRVVYRNNVSFPNSVHPHGVFYDKDSEGAPYVDETADTDKADDAVPPGGTHVYARRVIPVRFCGCITRTPTRTRTSTPG